MHYAKTEVTLQDSLVNHILNERARVENQEEP